MFSVSISNLTGKPPLIFVFINQLPIQLKNLTNQGKKIESFSYSPVKTLPQKHLINGVYFIPATFPQLKKFGRITTRICLQFE